MVQEFCLMVKLCRASRKLARGPYSDCVLVMDGPDVTIQVSPKAESSLTVRTLIAFMLKKKTGTVFI